MISKIDELGRIVIPSEIRKSLNWAEKEEIQIIKNEDFVILKKSESDITENEDYCVYNHSK